MSTNYNLQDIQELLAGIDHNAYTEVAKKASAYAVGEIRRTFLDMERKAAERDGLRELLIEQGIENARLAILVAQASAGVVA